MMKKLIYILALGLLIVSCQNKKGENGGHEHHQPEKAPTEQSDNSKKSIPQEAHGNVGDTHITIKYHSPAVRERVIWGGLVPYGEVWVTGAHSATNIEFSKAIQVEETTIPKGKYAFFTIPETGMPLTERLTYTIEDKGEGSGAIRMLWEKLSVSLPFKTD